MATKKKYGSLVQKAVKQDTQVKDALAVREPPNLASVEALESASLTLWETFSNSISRLTPEQYAPALQFIKTTEKLAADAGKLIKPMIVQLLKARGKVATDAGTRRLSVGGYALEIQPQSTSLDEKKVEALLRAKNLDVTKHMDQVILYKVNVGKLDTLVSDGKLTKEEVETCRPDESWKVMSPKKED